MGETRIRLAHWDYKPKGPFHVIVRLSDEEEANSYNDHKKLQDAVDSFVMAAVPVGAIRIAYIHDMNGVVLCGYFHPSPLNEAAWYGVEAGFAALAMHHLMDQLEVAIAEIQAREHASI